MKKIKRAETADNTAYSLRAYVLALRDIAFGKVVYGGSVILSLSPNQTYRRHCPTTHSKQKFKVRFCRRRIFLHLGKADKVLEVVRDAVLEKYEKL